MAKAVNLQDIVKHIVNGTLEVNICQICLQPLRDLYENNAKEDKQHCISDILRDVCDIKISNVDEFKVCALCYISALEAYKFYIMARQNHHTIQFYVNEITKQVNSNIIDDLESDSLCITLPAISSNKGVNTFSVNKIPYKKLPFKTASTKINEETQSIVKEDKSKMVQEENILMILDDNGKPAFYKPQTDGSLMQIDDGSVSLNEFVSQLPEVEVKKKVKRKRNPMEYKLCSKCPVRYRFVRKLIEHMKEEHGIELFVCKVCQAMIEEEHEFNQHLQTHTGIHTCAICSMVFKKRETIIAHFKWHEEMKALSQLEGAHVCEVCGLMFRNGEELRQHHEKKHVKKYTCYYCGRMYKGEMSFEMHIKKHEMNNDIRQEQNVIKKEVIKKRKRKYTCPRCDKDFVDERALLWHDRLHTNERPYLCDVCGRGFVSLNRRNQHAVCAHTAPSRRCPLCPALFHLRSMVNTHIKKVHLKTHKRRNRTSKYQNVFWKTETVPIQELSVSIQNKILELKSAQREVSQTPK